MIQYIMIDGTIRLSRYPKIKISYRNISLQFLKHLGLKFSTVKYFFLTPLLLHNNIYDIKYDKETHASIYTHIKP